MPYADNDGVKIFYKVVGDGPPLILHHGLGGTHENWIKLVNYVEILKDIYRLILMDARGRGRSDKPHSPEKHSQKYMVGDVTAILDDLGVEKAHFWGYSMGGRVGLATGKYAPDRFNSLIIGGNGLSEKDSEGEMEELKGYIRRFEQGIDAVIETIEKGRGTVLEDWERDKWLNSDLEALIAYSSNYENIGMADYLPTLTIPCLLYAGAEDKYPHSRAKACAEIMQNATFVSLPGLNHSGAFRSRDQVIPHVLKFLENLQ
ncbi:MAG: alpha/beta fold hydrolase [Candidatus Thorarchaeota archaeon]|jgi:pimeloyl-ACP methyl ester carboxylesterase